MISAPLVDTANGTVSRLAYSDAEVYEREMERVFARSWQFLGHDCYIPNSGDYLATYMGEDPVILWRDDQGEPHAFLNTCRHRGNRICLFEKGNASTFTCGYHGWTYNSRGELAGLPFHTEAYYDDFDRSAWSLAEAPRLTNYGGLIFACWDAAAPSLEDFLGEARWYLDTIVLVAEDLGGYEVVASSRYEAHGNWKIPAENFAGDHYHNPTTHGSSYKLGLRNGEFAGPQQSHGPFEVALKPGHGLGGLMVGQRAYEMDVRNAQKIGPEAVDFVTARWEALQRRLGDAPAKAYSFSHSTIFPNLAIWGGSALRGIGLFTFHPRGPLHTEVRQNVVLPKQAPESVKAQARIDLGRGGHFASGLFEQDDANNFERVTESTRTLLAKRYPFSLGMGLHQEGRWPGQEEWDVQGLPGVVGPRFSEHVQRHFYAYWAELMDRPS
ncbi:MAG TPA: aromatic ring-hydroxylating dioxygenase subunit alpha [Chloroflexota bacterium]|nr:aromatic ring-hydroxylating dioxygenase subunit alpha [Chloroflexota bacterium]